jgi:5-methylcytosine-specific restriction endonuclease McrA
MTSNYKQWAPKCAFPDCINKVVYHRKNGNSYKWKMFCSPHQKNLRPEVDRWKMGVGCSNTDAHHGFVCTSHITSPSQLDVNHIDGDRHNQNPDNLEILCKVCHQRVTIQNNHHVKRYSNQVDLNPRIFDF